MESLLEFGYIGLFVGSLLAATIFPFSSDVLLIGMLVAGGEIEPRIQEFPKCVLFTVLLAIPIYIFNLIFDTNFMFLMYAEAGNPLLLFEQLLGHHLLGVPIIEGVVVAILYTPFHLYYKKKARN